MELSKKNETVMYQLNILKNDISKRERLVYVNDSELFHDETVIVNGEVVHTKLGP